MSTAQICKAEGEMKVICQMCSVEGHSADCCKWVYSCCKESNCHGIRKMTTARTNENFGRKYLECLTCSSFQWLDEAMQQVGTSKAGAGCFSCGQTTHWKNSCPWLQSKCKVCHATMSLKVSGRPQTQGWKYLKCPKCSKFQWLYEAIKESEEASTSAEVTLTMKLSDFCDHFEATCTLKK